MTAHVRVERAMTTAILVGDFTPVPELKTLLIEKGIEVKNIKYGEDLILDADYIFYWIGGEGWETNFDAVAPTGKLIILEPAGFWGAKQDNSHVAVIIRLGHILSQGYYEPLLTSLSSSASLNFQIILPGDGLGNLYPLAGIDAAIGIVDAGLSPSAVSPIYLVPGEGSSLLSLAYKLRTLLPHKVDVIFDEHAPWHDLIIPWTDAITSQQSINWSPSNSLDTYFPKYISWLSNHPQKRPKLEPKIATIALNVATKPHLSAIFDEHKSTLHRVKKIEFVPLRNASHSKKKIQLKLKMPQLHLPAKMKTVIYTMILAIFFYLSSVVIAGALTYRASRNIANLFDEPNISVSAYTPALSYFQANILAFAPLPSPWKIQFRELGNLIDVLLQSVDASKNIQALQTAGRDISSFILGQSDINIVETLSTARVQVEALYAQLSLIDGALPVTPPSIIPKSMVEDYSTLKNRLTDSKRLILTAKAIFGITPDIIGLGGRRKYALLLQNNMELRPTGGFIGSFALASFENGKLYDLPIYDVYAADGQLKGHVEPPAEIKRHLGEVNWFFRDSNWDPDFPTTAARTDWFIKKTLSQDVDGVIGINISVISELLRAIGPVMLPDYEEQISAENLYERAEYHSEVGFFPGSTQKKEFLGALTTAIITRLHNLDLSDTTKVLGALSRSIDNKEITIALDNPSSADVFHRLGWDGSLRSDTCLEPNCTDDYLAIIDANLGVNKANYFIKRQIKLTVDINKDSLISQQLDVTYTNTSTSSSWPAGSYKNYSRIYLPADSELQGVDIDGIPLQAQDITESSEHGKKVIGFLVTVPITKSAKVTVKYHHTKPLDPVNPGYSLYWQKQPGTSADPLNILVHYPLFLTPSIISPLATVGVQELSFDLQNSTDRRIFVRFSL